MAHHQIMPNLIHSFHLILPWVNMTTFETMVNHGPEPLVILGNDYARSLGHKEQCEGRMCRKIMG